MRFRNVALAGSMAFLLIFFIERPESRPQSLLRDFNAFYCAGKTIDHGADPYRNEPLGTCERSAQRPDFLERAPVYLAVPAPLPGYALAPFALLALLPYGAAACMWTCIVLASFALTIRWLRAFTMLPLPAIVAALALSDGYVGVTLGQIAPIAIAAIVGAAYAITRGNASLAACASATAMLEPHMGLPACIALIFLRPRTIVPFAACGMLCVGTSVALIGMHANIEYFTSVIGAHALSEALNVKQLSLAALLVRSGLPALLAVRLGTLWYAAMIVAGVVIGQHACRALAGSLRHARRTVRTHRPNRGRRSGRLASHRRAAVASRPSMDFAMHLVARRSLAAIRDAGNELSHFRDARGRNACFLFTTGHARMENRSAVARTSSHGRSDAICRTDRRPRLPTPCRLRSARARANKLERICRISRNARPRRL
jgi:hypothetical protein